MTEIRRSWIHDTVTGREQLTVVNPDLPNPILTADSSHPHWDEIVEGVRNNDPNVYALFDIKSGLVSRMKQLSERVSYNGTDILFDGDVQEGPLADHLLRCVESGVKDYAPVVKFWEKVAQNPSERSRKQLFSWLRTHDFTITPDGDILGYKGVVTGVEGNYLSLHRGAAFVDGNEIKGQIPNQPGTVVTMPRASVSDNPAASCSHGLHVGDWSYASSFGDVVLEVHVNPRDVVSIPYDAEARKMRSCRYRVVRVRDAASGTPIASENEEWAGDVGYAPR